ncbi:MAG: tetratricopeptide repeat protein [Bacteroidia bacterium]|nr:tetratricopeptide repeat protein [Bacteroidia bacterium]
MKLTKLKFLIAVFFISVSLFAEAQNNRFIDSLKLKLKSASHDSIRLRILDAIVKEETDETLINKFDEQLFSIAQKNLSSNPSSNFKNTCLKYKANFIFRKGLSYYRQSDYANALEKYNESLKIRENINDKVGISYSLNSIGLIYSTQGDYVKALEFYNKSLKISQALQNKSRISTTLYNMGVVYYNQGDIPKALEFYNKSLKIDEELGDKSGISFSLNTIGIIYDRQGDYTKAIEYYNKSLKILDEIGDKSAIAGAHINIGNIYSDQDDILKALEYYNKALKIYDEIGDKSGVSLALNNIGIVYSDEAVKAIINKNTIKSDSLLKKSLDYNIRSLAIREEIGDKSGISASLVSIGVIYDKEGDYLKALEYFNRSLKINEELGEKSGIAASLNNLGKIYIKRNDITKALTYAKREYNLAKETGYVQDIRDAAKLLEEIYFKQGNYKLSRQYFGEYISMRDSISKDENQKLVQMKYFQYQYEKQAATDSIANSKVLEIKNIELSRQVAESKKQKIIILFVVSGLILLVIIAFIILRSLRITRKQKSIIEEQKQMVDEKNFMLNQQNEEISTQRDEIEAQRDLVITQKEEIEFIHNEVSQSIDYATRLQAAVLPGLDLIKDTISDHFVIYRPKHKVSGDFYWWAEIEDHLIITVADCTGHGVPGAFMSMLGISFLREIVVKEYMTNPAIVLKRLRKEIIHALKQKGTSGEQKDGMDIALITINKENLEMQFAGANNPLYILRNNELIEIKGDKMPISIHINMEPFKNNDFKLEKGDCVYLFTDGFADQFGGPKSRKFMYKQFKEILLANNNLPMSEQKVIIETAFEEWRGNGEQIDDVTILGIRI